MPNLAHIAASSPGIFPAESRKPTPDFGPPSTQLPTSGFQLDLSVWEFAATNPRIADCSRGWPNRRTIPNNDEPLGGVATNPSVVGITQTASSAAQVTQSLIVRQRIGRSSPGRVAVDSHFSSDVEIPVG